MKKMPQILDNDKINEQSDLSIRHQLQNDHHDQTMNFHNSTSKTLHPVRIKPNQSDPFFLPFSFPYFFSAAAAPDGFFWGSSSS